MLINCKFLFRKSPSSDLSQSWVNDHHSNMRSSSESHRLHSPVNENVEDGVRRPHSSKDTIQDKDISLDMSGVHKRHSSKETISSDDYVNLKKTSKDSSKSLSDGNVTRLGDSVPVRSISQPVNISQVSRLLLVFCKI